VLNSEAREHQKNNAVAVSPDATMATVARGPAYCPTVPPRRAPSGMIAAEENCVTPATRARSCWGGSAWIRALIFTFAALRHAPKIPRPALCRTMVYQPEPALHISTHAPAEAASPPTRITGP